MKVHERRAGVSGEGGGTLRKRADSENAVCHAITDPMIITLMICYTQHTSFPVSHVSACKVV